MSVSTFSSVFFYFFCGLFSLTLLILSVKTVFGIRAGLLKKGLFFVFLWLVSSALIFLASGIYFIGAAHTVEPSPSVKIESASIMLLILTLLWIGLSVFLVKYLKTPKKISLR
jgi:hypothetical protein